MICVINNCKNTATKRFSPDMDIQGIGVCDKHIEDVRLAYIALMQGDEDMYNSLIGEKVKKVQPVNRKSEETRPEWEGAMRYDLAMISIATQHGKEGMPKKYADKVIARIKRDFISKKALKDKLEEDRARIAKRFIKWLRFHDEVVIIHKEQWESFIAHIEKKEGVTLLNKEGGE